MGLLSMSAWKTCSFALLRNAWWMWWTPEPGRAEGRSVSILQGGQSQAQAHTEAYRGSSLLASPLAPVVRFPGDQHLRQVDVQSG